VFKNHILLFPHHAFKKQKMLHKHNTVFNAQNKLEVQNLDIKYKSCSKTAKEENSVECYYTDKKNIRGLK